MLDLFTKYEALLTYLPLTLVIPILFAFTKTIFNSFALDNFDLIFLNSEKRTLVKTIRVYFTNISISFFIFITFFICAFIIQLDDNIFLFYFSIFLLFLLIFIIWLIFYYLIGFIFYFVEEIKKIEGLKNKILVSFDISINFLPNPKYKKFDEGIKFFVIYFFGVTMTLIFINFVITDNELNLIKNWVLFLLLITTFSILFVLWGRKNSKVFSTHFKFIGCYSNNTLPIEMYLDRIIDNSTHLLSDKESKYKAIKYLKSENSEFVIELYEIEKREILKPWDNIEKKDDEYVETNKST